MDITHSWEMGACNLRIEQLMIRNDTVAAEPTHVSLSSVVPTRRGVQATGFLTLALGDQHHVEYLLCTKVCNKEFMPQYEGGKDEKPTLNNQQGAGSG